MEKVPFCMETAFVVVLFFVFFENLVCISVDTPRMSFTILNAIIFLIFLLLCRQSPGISGAAAKKKKKKKKFRQSASHLLR